MTPAEMIANYVKLRDYKKAAADEFSKSMEKVNQAMQKLEAKLLESLDQSGSNSISCDAGTVYRNTQHSAVVRDRKAFLDYILATGDWDALDVKANKTYVREQAEKAALVPGVELTSVYTVGVRRKSLTAS
jgi:hypothetical protein